MKNNFKDEVGKILRANRDSHIINDDMKITDPVILEEKFPNIATQILTLHKKDLAKLKEENGRLKSIIKDWKDGNRISKYALEAFVEGYNAGCEKGKEIDPDTVGYFCECLDPIKD